MIAPESLVCQKKGAEGEEEEARGQRKAGPTGTPMRSADSSIGQTWSGASEEWSSRKHGR